MKFSKNHKPIISILILAASMNAAEHISLSGRVLASDLSSKGVNGATISLAGRNLSTQSDSLGHWSLLSTSGVRSKKDAKIMSPISHLEVTDGRVYISTNGHDFLGRPMIRTHNHSRIENNYLLRAKSAPDTLIYTINGRVFLRDTISNLIQGGLIRVLDESVNPDIVYGYLNDKRDNKVYRVVSIGSQTWMAQNLNFKVDSSWWYNNDSTYSPKYGRLYQWASALKIPDSCLFDVCSTLVEKNHQGVCPENWHIPSFSDWEILINTVKSDPRVIGNGQTCTALKATTGYRIVQGVYNHNGTDIYGFSVFPGGDRTYNGSVDKTYKNRFGYIGSLSNYWSTNEYNAVDARHVSFYGDRTYIDYGDFRKEIGRYLRCVMN